ncbi:Hint domain-containing protein [Aquirhabdus sp.]|uniref:Hint domain-containing protein n=1 Tax=Aquirhabdus sp. TaxID=2824160 RepID=UPI00396CBDF9
MATVSAPTITIGGVDYSLVSLSATNNLIGANSVTLQLTSVNGSSPATATIATGNGLVGATLASTLSTSINLLVGVGGAIGPVLQTNNVSVALISCYLTGSLIRTLKGDVPVEQLQVGDIAITSSGEKRAIQWIGHTTAHMSKFDINRPVCITSGAFGTGLPYADLYLSPRHSICIKASHEEVLIPVENLINDITVKQVSMDEVTYWHVELESHDVLIANGLPSESYLDCGNRSEFAKHHGILNLDWENAIPGHHCHPVIESGPMLEQVKAQLQSQVGAQDWIKHLNLMIDNETDVRLAS